MRSLLIGIALAVIAVPAVAQQNPNDKQTRYAVQDINFDLWCQETAVLPPDRCDKRTTEDEASYEAYRNAVEKYEIPYLQRKAADQNLSQILIHPDPVPSENPASHPSDRQIESPKPNP
jgi:hypothetical protein